MQISTELSTGERNRLLEEAQAAASAPETSAAAAESPVPAESPIPAESQSNTPAAEASVEPTATPGVDLNSKSKYLEPGGVVRPTKTPSREADLDTAPTATPEPTASPSPTPTASPSPTAEPEQDSQSKGGFFSWLLDIFR